MFGFLEKLVGKDKKPQTKQPSNSSDTANFNHNVCIRPKTSDENSIAELHRQATKYKDLKDWDNAILCLQEAEALKNNVAIIYPIAHYLRLPLFLQQGGHFEASIKEFQKLIDRIEARAIHYKNTSNEMFTYSDLAAIYKSMSVAYSREKQKEDADDFLKLSVKNNEKHRKLLEKQRESDARKLASRKKKSANI